MRCGCLLFCVRSTYDASFSRLMQCQIQAGNIMFNPIINRFSFFFFMYFCSQNSLFFILVKKNTVICNTRLYCFCGFAKWRKVSSSHGFTSLCILVGLDNLRNISLSLSKPNISLRSTVSVCVHSVSRLFVLITMQQISISLTIILFYYEPCLL